MRRWEDTVSGDVDYCSHYGKQYGGFSKKLKIELPYYSTIPLLDIYSEKTILKKKYMHLYVHSATVYNRQDKKHPKCPWTVE